VGITATELSKIANEHGEIKVATTGLLWLELRDAVKQGLLVQLTLYVFSLPDGG